MASIVDRLRGVAEKVGARSTGSTVQDVLSDIEAKLADSAQPQVKPSKQPKKVEKPFFTDEKAEEI